MTDDSPTSADLLLLGTLASEADTRAAAGPVDAGDPSLEPGRPTQADTHALRDTLPDTGPAAVAASERRQVAHYELLRLLGRGGMGSVHLARDTRLGRLVALKLLRPDLPGGARRFLREAQATASFQHENIVVIHDVGEDAGTLYMALEYLEGRSMRALLRQAGALRPERALELMVPVARALVSAHERGIVHRDLKPDNVVVTSGGRVKVLDFGIAKLMATDEGPTPAGRSAPGLLDEAAMTRVGALIGTLPYMAPEQLRGADVDARVDQWAFGMMLYEVLLGGHPLSGWTRRELDAMGRGDCEVPPIGERLPELPGELERVVRRCLEPRPEDRYDSTADLLQALLAAQPQRRLSAEEGSGPYPGLAAFHERDAEHFFGRRADVARLAQLLVDQPLAALVGPSGVGKSSLVRAGLLPALKRQEAWEAFVVRPGRAPLDALADLVHEASLTPETARARDDRRRAALQQLEAEPGSLGALLRQRCALKGTRLLLFVDQFEELYTLTADEAARQAFVGCLLGAADDPSSPVRVVLSLRSDFLDRVGESPRLLAAVTRGLALLQAPKREQLREALVGPAESAGYAFEAPAIVEAMLDALEGTAGALPLLQFAAGQLWEGRDRARKLLTLEAYEDTGGVVGLVATHADAIIAGLPGPQRAVARALFRRLVTAEGTRAIVPTQELAGLANPEQVQALLQRLVAARLLVVQQPGDRRLATVELAHESLIEAWPTLRGWLAEGAEHAAFVDQLVSAARQWDAKGRPQGLVWRGEAAEDARHFERHYTGELAALERDYLDAVAAVQGRARRLRRVGVTALVVALLAIVVTGGVVLLRISAAEQAARSQATKAMEEARKSMLANKRLEQQIELVRAKESERAAAEEVARSARGQAESRAEELARSQEALAGSNAELRAALAEAQQARVEAEAAEAAARAAATDATEATARAQAAAAKERALAAQLEAALTRERERVKGLQKRFERIESTLR